MREHLVIVGGGQAATQTAQSVRQDGFDGRISLISEEPELPYQRPPLSKKFLAGEMERDRLTLKPREFYQTREIDLLLGQRVAGLDVRARQLSLEGQGTMEFTQLLLATGGEPRRLALPGAELPGVHYLRSIADVVAIREDFLPGRRLVIVGAGYIGLEVAAVAIGAGLEVTVLEADRRVMSRAVCEEISAFYADRHRQAGVDLRLGAELKALHGAQRVQQAETADGQHIDCDLVIVGIGITPRTELAASAGLKVSNGIAVDPACRTSAPGVFAAGDCTSHPHPWVGQRIRLESVQNAIEQGKAAAASICGREQAFDAIPWFWSDQYDLKLQIAGLSAGYDETVTRGDPAGGHFSVFYLASGRVIAVDCINDPRVFIAMKKHLQDKPAWPAAALADTGTDLESLASPG